MTYQDLSCLIVNLFLQGNGKRVIFPIGNPRNVYFETFQNRRQDRDQNLSKTYAKTIQNRSLEGVWAPIAVKATFQADFARILGASWGRLGRSWGRLGASWARLGGVLGASSERLGPSWDHLRTSCARLGASCGFSAEKLVKTIDFASEYRIQNPRKSSPRCSESAIRAIVRFLKPTLDLERFECQLGSILAPFSESWGVMGASWGLLEASWRHLGSILGASWRILGHFQPSRSQKGEKMTSNINLI